ncbi:MAG: hypothetical protein H0X66_03235 [Verrucomicrobia bacterium]|nr:hypothetical protein [Verrucomicrobiota bacterium]
MKFLLLTCLTFLLTAEVMAENTNVVANPPVKEVQPGIFEIGKVRLDKSDRSISFPAAINMTNGPVEYLLVSAVGKLHESVLKTEVDPMHIHLSALLLGAKGAQTNLTVHDFDTKEIPGESIDLLVQWTEDGREKKVRAEQLVFNTATLKVTTKGPWIYNGSQVHGGTLVAQRDGLIVAIMSDPLALMNNPRPGRENDEIWEVNKSSVPPLNTPVQFILQFKGTKK